MKDILGASCSGLCLAHCLALPILAATGTSLTGLAFLSGESTHLWLSAAMVGIALWTFPSGWRTHKQLMPGLLGFIGAMLMTLALTAPEPIEVYWTVASGVTFISGHLMNRHLLIMRNIQ